MNAEAAATRGGRRRSDLLPRSHEVSAFFWIASQGFVVVESHATAQIKRPSHDGPHGIRGSAQAHGRLRRIDRSDELRIAVIGYGVASRQSVNSEIGGKPGSVDDPTAPETDRPSCVHFQARARADLNGGLTGKAGTVPYLQPRLATDKDCVMRTQVDRIQNPIAIAENVGVTDTAEENTDDREAEHKGGCGGVE